MTHHWTIEPSARGVDVHLDGRAWRYDRDDLEEALDDITGYGRFDPESDTVTHIDEVGYRQDLDVSRLRSRRR